MVVVNDLRMVGRVGQAVWLVVWWQGAGAEGGWLGKREERDVDDVLVVGACQGG
jgi:hypothetical protein